MRLSSSTSTMSITNCGEEDDLLDASSSFSGSVVVVDNSEEEEEDLLVDNDTSENFHQREQRGKGQDFLVEQSVKRRLCSLSRGYDSPNYGTILSISLLLAINGLLLGFLSAQGATISTRTSALLDLVSSSTHQCSNGAGSQYATLHDLTYLQQEVEQLKREYSDKHRQVPVNDAGDGRAQPLEMNGNPKLTPYEEDWSPGFKKRKLDVRLSLLLERRKVLDQEIAKLKEDIEGFHRPFKTREELVDAVDSYMAAEGEGGKKSTLVAHLYGYPIGSWNVSLISNFNELFDVSRNNDLYSFNEDISEWDVSQAITMNRMFAGCVKFNGDISQWNVGQVEDMHGMFKKCKSFDGDLSQWDVSSVQDMRSMFRGCSIFNGDLSQWNVWQAEDMYGMFSKCRMFNGDLSEWDVSTVEDMRSMFRGCEAFNGNPISWWDVEVPPEDLF